VERGPSRGTSDSSTSRITAPIVAWKISRKKPPPTQNPRRGSTNPAIAAPAMPTTTLVRKPKPPPRTKRPASQPAIAPTRIQVRRPIASFPSFGVAGRRR
jgi:hypothetical protein